MNPIIALGIDAAMRLLELVFKARANLQQSGEWTPAQEAEFTNKLALLPTKPHWQPQPETKK